MFDWKVKASNAILMNEVPGKGRAFRCKFLEAGLVKYSFGVCLLPEEVLANFAYNFVGCPVIINHQDLTKENADNARVGVISEVEYVDGWYWCGGIIFDNEAIELINKGYNVSCQYEITEYAENKEGKLHNGNPYDKIILDGKPEHLAIVEHPRYENAMIAVNAIDKTDIEADDIIEAINDIKETDMFKSLFKKENDMTKDEIKAIFLECLSEMKAANAAEEKPEEKVEDKEEEKAENEAEETKAENEAEEKEAENAEDSEEDKAENECDYKKMYEELKAKVDKEVENECKKEEAEKAKNSINEQKKAILSSGKKEVTSTYLTKSKAIELGNELY